MIFSDVRKKNFSDKWATIAIVKYDTQKDEIEIIKKQIKDSRKSMHDLEKRAYLEAKKIFPEADYYFVDHAGVVFNESLKLDNKLKVLGVKGEINPAHYALIKFSLGRHKINSSLLVPRKRGAGNKYIILKNRILTVLKNLEELTFSF